MSKIDPKDARQGSRGRPVLIVLVAALALALLAALFMGVFGASQPDENIGGPDAAGVETSAPPPEDGAAPGGTVTPGETPPAPAPAN